MKKSYLMPKVTEAKLCYLSPCHAQYTTLTPFTLTNQGSLFDECGGGDQSFTKWALTDIVAGANITVSVTPSGANTDIVLRILRPDNSEVVGCSNNNVGSPTGESFGPFVADQDGEYEIHVHNAFTGGSGNSQPYSIFVSGTNDVTPGLLPQATANCDTACPSAPLN